MSFLLIDFLAHYLGKISFKKIKMASDLKNFLKIDKESPNFWLESENLATFSELANIVPSTNKNKFMVYTGIRTRVIKYQSQKSCHWVTVTLQKLKNSK
jgi:hypothetical protein